MWWKYVLIVLIGYFLGNFSVASTIAKKRFKQNMRDVGSGNPGSLNIYRNYGTKIGILNFCLDILKGVLPALVGKFLIGEEGIYISGLAAVFGHCFPVFYKFRGGKGIATTFGVLLVGSPIATVIGITSMFILTLISQYGGIVNICVVSGIVCYIATFGTNSTVVLCCLLAIFVIVWFGHRKNILKSLLGTEGKTDFRRVFKRKKKEIDLRIDAGK